MAGREQTLTHVELLTLAALGDHPRYGYELSERIEALSEGTVRIRPGNLYRVLHRLQDRELAEEVDYPDGEAEDARRQYFQATAEGRALAARQLQLYAGLLERAPGLRAAPGDA